MSQSSDGIGQKGDPPLTPLGLRQAEETGKFLALYFEKHRYKFDKIIIETSPYLSCIMTAARIAHALDEKDVFVHYRAIDYLSIMMGENPVEQLDWIKAGANYKVMH